MKTVSDSRISTVDAQGRVICSSLPETDKVTATNGRKQLKVKKIGNNELVVELPDHLNSRNYVDVLLGYQN